MKLTLIKKNKEINIQSRLIKKEEIINNVANQFKLLIKKNLKIPVQLYHL